MPTSSHFSITPMIKEIRETKPNTILDVGFGYGKWGFMCIEKFETQGDRIYPEDWELKIDGIEIWKRYVEKLPWVPHFYDNMYNGDALDVIKTLGHYDLIILGDVVEHLEKERGEELLRQGIEKADKCCLLSIPIGDWTNKKSIRDGNTHEHHLAIWTESELVRIGKEFGINVGNYFIQRQRDKMRAEVCVMAFRK